jgi:hypothetical protein
MGIQTYQDFLNELSEGNQYGIFIDDTGSPGLQTKRLHPERSSWIGVVISPHDMPEVLQQMPRATGFISEELGASEFHFTDIWSGRKEFKEVEWGVRFGIFQFMTEIFAQYKFPIYVQTFDPVTLEKVRTQLGERTDFFEKLKLFNFRKPKDAALFFLLFLHLRNHIKKERVSDKIKARVFVDEGFKPNGCTIQSKIFENEFADGMICFASSKTIFPIQLADFAAFMLNKSQLLLEKENKTDRDIQLLQLWTVIGPLFRNIGGYNISFN